MKYFLVVMFLMQDGTWKPGDIIAPDGWSSTQHSTLKKCEYRRDSLNNYLISIELNERVVARCVNYDPSIPSTGI